MAHLRLAVTLTQLRSYGLDDEIFPAIGFTVRRSFRFPWDRCVHLALCGIQQLSISWGETGGVRGDGGIPRGNSGAKQPDPSHPCLHICGFCSLGDRVFGFDRVDAGALLTVKSRAKNMIADLMLINLTY